jgi:predicted alpha/beta superfamily hydrolase
MGNIRIASAIALLLVCSDANSAKSDNLIIGKTVTLPSSVLQKGIELSVHVPESSRDDSARYPVLFTFQTHFEQVAGAVKNLYDYSLIPEMMVVRIDNYEFGYLTPTAIPSRPNSGQADKFLEFFEKELFPFVDSSFPTHPYRIAFSNSWGAMFVAYAVLSRPTIFNAGIASIPWIMYDNDDRFFLSNVERLLATREYNNVLYMTMDNEMDLLPDLPLFIDILRNNPIPGLDWEYHHWPEEDHASTPYRSIYSGLRCVFAPWGEIPEEVVGGGIAAVEEYEHTVNDRFGYDIGLSGTALRLAAQSLQKQSDHVGAIAIYEYAASRDPEDPYAQVSLGRALEANGQLERAQQVYEVAVRMAESQSAPQIKWIKSFLDNIKEKLEANSR